MDHPAADHLSFAACLAEVQAEVQAEVLARGQPPASHSGPAGVDITTMTLGALLQSDDWTSMLDDLLSKLRERLPTKASEATRSLMALDRSAQAALALALLQERYEVGEPSLSPLVWAALSLAWAQRAQHPKQFVAAHQATGAALCPMCNCRPVGSLVLGGERAGLRYLQCALCETRWHLVRARCSNCDSAAPLEYLSFDMPGTATKAECCSACRGYLKASYQQLDREVEVAADDLATLALDVAVEMEGYHRTGMNPFAFPY